MAEVTFPQLIQRACGIDVHLKVVVATIDGAGIQRETRSFKTFTSSLNELKEWLLSNGVTHVERRVPVFTGSRFIRFLKIPFPMFDSQCPSH